MKSFRTSSSFSIRYQVHQTILTFLLLICGASTAPHSVLADPGSDPTLSFDQVGSGELLRRTDDAWVPVPMLGMEVDLTVTGPIVRGRLEQVFYNTADSVIEAIYLFPLPENASVHHMELRIGERRIVSEIREREDAREVYEEARSEGRKAALVEEHRPNLFSTEVANINPGQTVEVHLEFVHEADYLDGVFSTAFPLTFTPRYVPGSDAIDRDRGIGAGHPVSLSLDDSDRITPPFRHPATWGAPRARIEVSLDPGFSIGDVRSNSHRIEVESLPGPGGFEIRTQAETVVADRDFLLSWHPEATAQLESRVFRETLAGEDHLLLVLLPPAASGDSSTTPGSSGEFATETLFVVDISGSMDGPSIAQARDALAAAVDRLDSSDRFNLVAFNQDRFWYEDRFQEATPENRNAVRRWIAGLRANGGTEIGPALHDAIRAFRSAEERGACSRRIVFITDGAVSNEAQLLGLIENELGGIRLHALGIGHAPNRYLMRKIAMLGRGHSEFISSDRGIDNRIEAFLSRIERPRMIAAEIEPVGFEIDESFPSRLPDLYPGEPLFVCARIEGELPPGAELRFRAQGSGGVVSERIEIESTQEAGIATRWARYKVDDWMEEERRGMPAEEVRPVVVQLGIDYHLVTRYTSLVATEERVTAEGEAVPAEVANALPHGSTLGGRLPRGGTSAPLRRVLGGLFLLAGIVSIGWFLSRR